MTMSEPGPRLIAGGAFTIKPDDHRPNYNKNVKGLPSTQKKQRVDGRNLAKQQLLFLCMVRFSWPKSRPTNILLTRKVIWIITFVFYFFEKIIFLKSNIYLSRCSNRNYKIEYAMNENLLQGGKKYAQFIFQSIIIGSQNSIFCSYSKIYLF